MNPQKKGTTASHERAWNARVRLERRDGFTDVDLTKLLRDCGMAQSVSEARRLLEQRVVWYDLGVHSGPGESTVFDRLRKVDEAHGLEGGRMFLVEPGTLVCVGKTPDLAACHRITFD